MIEAAITAQLDATITALVSPLAVTHFFVVAHAVHTEIGVAVAPTSSTSCFVHRGHVLGRYHLDVEESWLPISGIASTVPTIEKLEEFLEMLIVQFPTVSAKGHLVREAVLGRLVATVNT